MKIIHLTYPLLSKLSINTSSMAIGYFDGVHYGHQGVIGDAVRRAKELGIKSSVMTFEPHPKHLFGNSDYTQFITPLPQKLRIFESLGVDITYIVSFTLPFSKISPEQFVAQFLSLLDIKSVTVGFDFSFGFRGCAKPHDLQQLAKGQFQVRVVSSINSRHEKISSTNVRKALQTGNIEKVNQYLGRGYRIWGKLDSDLQGFQVTSPSILPAKGSYSVSVKSKYEVIKGELEITANRQYLKMHMDLPFSFFTCDYVEVEFHCLLKSESKLDNVDQQMASEYA